MSFSIRVEGLRFAAGHFATYGGDCEPLHGHSYEVAAEVEGGLSDDSWLIDFSDLKAIVRGLCEELDHRFLLQTQSAVLTLDRTGDSWRLRTPGGLEYSLPARDVAPLPIDNSTAERLAEYLSARVWEALESRGGHEIEKVAVEVWEGPGQRARHERAQEAEVAGEPVLSAAETRLPLD